MVDVSEKEPTRRTAVAKGKVNVNSKTFQLIADEEIEKGDVLEISKIAGIMGGKQTSDLIPMCHPLLIDGIDVKFSLTAENNSIHVFTTAKTTGKTGVEMEALTAASTACLTIYDMCKAVDKEIEIGEIKLLKKTGGKSGKYLADELTGKVVSLCISEEKGTAKQEVNKVYCREDYGLKGDAHAGDWHRQISLLAEEDIAKMKEKGIELTPGDFGENIITKGVNLLQFPVGTKVKMGEVLLELTQHGKECHDRCAIYEQVGDCIMPRRGVFAKVLQGGKLIPTTEMEVIIDD
jgi:cyclic pyranopterin phosphate synthase